MKKFFITILFVAAALSLQAKTKQVECQVEPSAVFEAKTIYLQNILFDFGKLDNETLKSIKVKARKTGDELKMIIECNGDCSILFDGMRVF